MEPGTCESHASMLMYQLKHACWWLVLCISLAGHLKFYQPMAAQLRTPPTSKSACRGIYNEAEAVLYKEIDYILEGKNADRFRRNFQDNRQIQVPRVFWQLTSPRAITLDYLPGTKITSVAALRSSGIDTGAVARRATEAYLVQILKHGFLHSDPHPGNIAVSAEGGLIFYDFGMMSSIVPATKDRLLDVFYGIYRKDAAQVWCL